MDGPLLRFDVFTLFPEIFEPYLQISILQRARQRGLLEVAVHNIRDWATDKHHVTDDLPYGGGGGMVMKPEPIFSAVESVLGSPLQCPLILMTPQGRQFTQMIAMELAGITPPAPELLGRVAPPPAGVTWKENAAVLAAPPAPGAEETPATTPPSEPEASSSGMSGPAAPSPRRLALLCGRYEGVDERVRQHLVTDEISIGDYVLTGGELAALVVIDAVTRLVPGVLGDPDGALDDSHTASLLEYPHYTRPPEFRGWQVPEVLLSGDHARISRWRRQQALLRTRQRRPDMFARVALTKKDKKFLEDIDKETDTQVDKAASD